MSVVNDTDTEGFKQILKKITKTDRCLRTFYPVEGTEESVFCLATISLNNTLVKTLDGPQHFDVAACSSHEIDDHTRFRIII